MSQHNVSNVSLPLLKIKLESTDTDDRDDDELGIGNDANGNVANIPSLWGVPLKYISLVTLALQNSLLTIIMHYSRVSTPPERTYSAATAVLMNEILKGFISLIIAFLRIDVSSGSHVPAVPFADPQAGVWRPTGMLLRMRKLLRDVFSTDCWKLSVPAILYVIQNNLQYVAVSNLEAATFQVAYQMKILTTAGFSVLLLRKKLSPAQWLSLLFLAVGVGVVQMQAAGVKPNKLLQNAQSMNPSKGFFAVVAACFTSGLAGVYFEMVLKNSSGDLWVRNVQLSLFSLLPAISPIIYQRDSTEPIGSIEWYHAVFRNFGPWAWATVAIQVLGGLVTAMVIKYSDNILKGFATSLSIVISFLASIALFDFRISFAFLLGSAIVLNATWLYNHQPKRPGLVQFVDKAAFSRTFSQWNESFNGKAPMKSPAIDPLHGGPAVVLSSGSRTSSFVSLTSLSTISTPPMSDSESDTSGILFGR